MNKKERLSKLISIASKVGFKAAKGLNFTERQEGRESAFSEEMLEKIKSLDLDSVTGQDFYVRLNKNEKKFIEAGLIYHDKIDQASELYDYLTDSVIKQPGDLFLKYKFDIASIQDIKEIFSKILSDSHQWHENLAKEQQKDGEGKGKYPNGYMTNDVVYSFDDGWNIVYVPAEGEVEPWDQSGSSSHDRVLEGNLMGLCLGSSKRLFQKNNLGKIYSVRDPNNNPEVTIRMKGGSEKGYSPPEEMKGKFNLNPSVAASKHMIEWFEQIGSDYKKSSDNKLIPPLTKEAVLEKIKTLKEKVLGQPWILSWYRKGIEELDRIVEHEINNPSSSRLIGSMIHKKYPELLEPYILKLLNNNMLYKFYPLGFEESMDKKPFVSMSALSAEIWKKYRNRDWIKKLLENIVEEYPNEFINSPISVEYKEYITEDIKKEFINNANLVDFFQKNLHKDIIEESMPEYAKRYPESYLYKLDSDKENPDHMGAKLSEEYRELAIKNLKDPKEFFDYRFQYKYPFLVREMIEKFPYKMEFTFIELPMESIDDKTKKFFNEKAINIGIKLLKEISKMTNVIDFVSDIYSNFIGLTSNYVQDLLLKNSTFVKLFIDMLIPDVIYNEFFKDTIRDFGGFLEDNLHNNSLFANEFLNQILQHPKNIIRVIEHYKRKGEKFNSSHFEEQFGFRPPEKLIENILEFVHDIKISNLPEDHEEVFKEFEWQSTGIDPDHYSEEGLSSVYEHSSPNSPKPEMYQKGPTEKPFEGTKDQTWNRRYEDGKINKWVSEKRNYDWIGPNLRSIEDFESFHSQPETYKRRIATLINLLDKKGFFFEAHALRKLATPIEDIYYPPSQKAIELDGTGIEIDLSNPIEVTNENSQIGFNESEYKDFFINMDELIDIYLVPAHLKPIGSRLLPSQDIAAHKLPIKEIEIEYMVEDFMNNSLHKKTKEETVNEEDFKKYLHWLNKSMKTDRLNIVWGLFDSSASPPTDFSPQWFAHDLLHAFEAIPFSKIKKLSDEYGQIVEDSLDESKKKEFTSIIDKYTPKVAGHDLIPTLFGLQVTNNVPEEIKQCFKTPNDYNMSLNLAIEIIKESKGYLVFLP